MAIFNAALFRKTRGSMMQKEFGGRLGIGKAHVSAIERGIRTPSVRTISRLIRISGIPAEDWLLTENSPASVTSDVQNQLNQKHFEYLQMQEKLWQLEQEEHRLKAQNQLSGQLVDILLGKCTNCERTEKIRECAVSAIKDGILSFEEVKSILRLRRTVLRGWVKTAKSPYQCQLTGQAIMASSPGEASLALKCANCIKRQNGECHGHGSEDPRDIVEMFNRLEANGIYEDADQSAFLTKYYNMSLPPEEIRNIRYKAKMGLPIPYEKLYMLYTDEV
jgi:transcriptional regulator with XRE-family HTH domain